MARWRCAECGWIGQESNVLTAPNPFADDNETMMGCPECREAGQMRRACDIEGCKQQAGCGTSIPNGYVWSCFEHRPHVASKGA